MAYPCPPIGDGNQLETFKASKSSKAHGRPWAARSGRSRRDHNVTRSPTDTLTGDMNMVATDDQEYRVNGSSQGRSRTDRLQRVRVMAPR